MAVPIISWPGPGPGAFGMAFYRICNIPPFPLFGIYRTFIYQYITGNMLTMHRT